MTGVRANNDPLALAIAARVRELLEVATAAGLRTGTWTARLDLRGLAAGIAHPTSGLMRFNRVLADENGADFITHTVAHEVAHLIAWWHWGRAGDGHGARWRQVMALFGSPAVRCHRYDTANSRTRSQRRWPYRCGCSETHTLSTTRHRRVRQGVTTYRCRRCGHDLVAVTDDPGG